MDASAAVLVSGKRPQPARKLPTRNQSKAVLDAEAHKEITNRGGEVPPEGRDKLLQECLVTLKQNIQCPRERCTMVNSINRNLPPVQKARVVDLQNKK